MPRWLSRILFAVIVTFTAVILALAGPARGQSPGGSGGGDSPSYVNDGKAVQLAAIPVPSYSPNFGWGIGAVVNAFFKIDRGDTLCPPASTGIFGFYTENRTHFYGLYQDVHLDEDTWRGKFVLARASVNFQTYLNEDLPSVGGNWLQYTSSSWFLQVQASRIVLPHIYLGLLYRWREAYLEFDLPVAIPEPERGRTLQYSGLGPVVSYDTRNNIFNATGGWFVDFQGIVNRDWLGSDRDFEQWDLKAVQYLGYRPQHVVAWQAGTQIGTGDVPFDAQAILGVRDIRGYADGKYRGNSKIFAEGEYRWNFHGRWGVVGFLGVGWAFDEIARMSLDSARPGVGFGGRWMMIESYRINIGVDIAWGQDDTVLYFRIGEAF